MNGGIYVGIMSMQSIIIQYVLLFIHVHIFPVIIQINVYALDWPQIKMGKASHLHENAKKCILNVLNHLNYNE